MLLLTNETSLHHTRQKVQEALNSPLSNPFGEQLAHEVGH